MDPPDPPTEPGLPTLSLPLPYDLTLALLLSFLLAFLPSSDQ